jgi:phosphopantetheinyl transferase
MINWIFADNSSIDFQDCQRNPESCFNIDEQNEYGKLRISKRKTEWLFSRWVCKLLVKESDGLPAKTPLQTIAIRKTANGVPFVDIAEVGRTGWLSLSHSTNKVLAAFSKDDSYRFGVDLEYLEERDSQLIEDYFTETESQWVNSASGDEMNFRANLIWSAKEAYLKAIEIGLQMDTRKIQIKPTQKMENVDGWHEIGFCVDGIESVAWRLFFRREAGFVLTMCLPSEKDVKLARFYVG